MHPKQDSRERAVLVVWRAIRWKAAGAAMILLITAVVVLAVAMYAGRLRSTVPITVEAPRSGLVLARRRDLSAAGEVAGLYAGTSPELLRAVDNATVTSETIAGSAEDLDALLLNLIGLADTTRAALTENERGFAAAVELLRPTSFLLDTYAPVLYCVVVGVARALPAAEAIIGGTEPGAIFNAGFMYGARPYTYPGDLPKVNATGGPRCDGILDRVPGSHADYAVTDTNESAPYVPSSAVILDAPSVFRVLFAGMPGVPR